MDDTIEITELDVGEIYTGGGSAHFGIRGVVVGPGGGRRKVGVMDVNVSGCDEDDTNACLEMIGPIREAVIGGEVFQFPIYAKKFSMYHNGRALYPTAIAPDVFDKEEVGPITGSYWGSYWLHLGTETGHPVIQAKWDAWNHRWDQEQDS